MGLQGRRCWVAGGGKGGKFLESRSLIGLLRGIGLSLGPILVLHLGSGTESQHCGRLSWVDIRIVFEKVWKWWVSMYCLKSMSCRCVRVAGCLVCRQGFGLRLTVGLVLVLVLCRGQRS